MPAIPGGQPAPGSSMYKPPASPGESVANAPQDPTSSGLQPSNLPIYSDPGYDLFSAITGMQASNSAVNLAQSVPEIQRQGAVRQSNLDYTHRAAVEGADTTAAQRGLSRSGMAAQKQADIAGQYGRSSQDISAGTQAAVDRSVALDAATQRALGAKGASTAVSTIGKTA